MPTKVANRQNLVHRLPTSHVSHQTVSHWENGKTIPDIQSLILLCELYGITLKDLLSDDVDVIRSCPRSMIFDILLCKKRV
ncbi:helix-turn-helix transcriptional regulator [Lentilactobacillus buchneri]|uniref:helix-turn-helix transcriptional regulator n=1 Tax=Lentilactobacillus buchneri TaxID=1581 RepID=UPI001CDC5036|nr:helix-turn-helix transcriptional regulator [Lentilactobacillus buchneri]